MRSFSISCHVFGHFANQVLCWVGCNVKVAQVDKENRHANVSVLEVQPANSRCSKLRLFRVGKERH